MYRLLFGVDSLFWVAESNEELKANQKKTLEVK
jgi:hypothetical protein